VSATGRVVFVGAGPGAADLITVRGARCIAEADVVLWPAGVVAIECVREHARPDAELIDSSGWGPEQALALYRRAAARRLTVAVLHVGSGELARQLDACRRLGMQVELVPGVSTFAAAAAAAGTSLIGTPVTVAGSDSSGVDCGQLRLFHTDESGTVAVAVSAAKAGLLAQQLRAGGYTDDTPVVVAYKVSWPDQLVVHTTLGELECTVKRHRLWRQTVFLVGRALQAKPFATGEDSRTRTYQPGRARGYRKIDKIDKVDWAGKTDAVATGQSSRRRSRSRRTS
jgi:precorrin-4/cobalt-precorrin-4 C11-methyltransferase